MYRYLNAKVLTKLLMIFLFLLLWSFSGNAANYRLEDKFDSSKPFILFDSDDRQPMSNVSGRTGAFDLDPNDDAAYCRIGTEKDTDRKKEGYYLKLTYSVDSSKPAFNGWWTKLNGADLSKFKAVTFAIKGDAGKGFSDIFKIELKDAHTSVYSVIEDITSQWKTYTVNFEDFEGDLASVNYSKMTEFVIVFEDWRMKIKKGRYYIDDIGFIPKDGETVSYGEVLKKSK
jgi:hypothetical protein